MTIPKIIPKSCYKTCVNNINNNDDDDDNEEINNNNNNNKIDDNLNNTNRIDKWLKKEKIHFKKQIRILLLGTGESGKSTILKQMKIIHGDNLLNDVNSDELKHIIYYNILKGMKVLIDAKNKLSIPWSNDNNDNDNIQSKADLLFRCDTTNITFEYFSRYITLIDLIWNDRGIQLTFQKRHLYQLSDGLPYLLNNLKRISSINYVPTNQDILHARIPTRSIIEYEVYYKKIPFKFIDIGGQRSQRKNWLKCFDNIITSILFIVSSIEYDQYLVEDSNINRLSETLNVFELITHSKYLSNTSIILFLNKTDLLSDKLKQLKKIQRSLSLQKNYYFNNINSSSSSTSSFINDFFPEFDGDPTNLQQVQQFLLNLFEQRQSFKKQLYSHFTTAIDTENIKRVFYDVRETVLQENIKSIIDLQ